MPRDPSLVLADLEAIKADGDARGFEENAVCALSSLGGFLKSNFW